MTISYSLVYLKTLNYNFVMVRAAILGELVLLQVIMSLKCAFHCNKAINMYFQIPDFILVPRRLMSENTSGINARKIRKSEH